MSAPVVQHGNWPICRESGAAVGSPSLIAGAEFNLMRGMPTSRLSRGDRSGEELVDDFLVV